MQSICNQYGLDPTMIMRAITPADDIAIPREELQAAREELSRKLLDIPIKKSSSGKVGRTAVVSYLAAMMVEAVTASKEPMPPSLAALLCRQLLKSNPKLAYADNVEEEAVKRAIVEFRSGESSVSIREAATRLGISVKIMRGLIEDHGFWEKVADVRKTIAGFEEFRKTCAL